MTYAILYIIIGCIQGLILEITSYLGFNYKLTWLGSILVVLFWPLSFVMYCIGVGCGYAVHERDGD